MSLFISQKNGIMEVREEIHSFTDTKRSWFYYDMEKNLVSSHGRQGDKPDHPMTDSARAWAEQHYVPKIAPYAPTPEEYLKSPEALALRQAAERAEKERHKKSMNDLFKRAEENNRLRFAEKCKLMFEETGISVKSDSARSAP